MSSPNEQLVENAAVVRAHLGRMVHQLKGDENQPFRAHLLAMDGYLKSLADLAEAGELHVQPAPGPAEVPAGVRNLRALGDETRGRLSNGGAWRVR